MAAHGSPRWDERNMGESRTPLEPSSRETLERGRAMVAAARRIVVLTGAGISAESGVLTFRGPDGLWQGRRPEELATPEAFRRDPRAVWEWYAWRRERIAACRPNAGHLALARLALERPGVALVTQNVDGLHELAAREVAGERRAEPAHPLELHGAIFRVRCTGCGARADHRDPVDAREHEALPRCRRCAGLLRPDVVWFGEPLPADTLDAAFRAASSADIALAVGTSAIVEPAASIPRFAIANGGRLIEVNPEPTPLSRAAAWWFELPRPWRCPRCWSGIPAPDPASGRSCPLGR